MFPAVSLQPFVVWSLVLGRWLLAYALGLECMLNGRPFFGESSSQSESSDSGMENCAGTRTSLLNVMDEDYVRIDVAADDGELGAVGRPLELGADVLRFEIGDLPARGAV